MNLRKTLLLTVLTTVAGLCIFGGYALATGGRSDFYGYFTNTYDSDQSGDFVLPQSSGVAIPSSVNTEAELISFIKGYAASSDTWKNIGADFIIQTMRGPQAGAWDHGRPTSTEIAQWEKQVTDFRLNGGTINWSTTYTYDVNSYNTRDHAGGSGTNDDAFYNYASSRSASGVITFVKNGVVVYAIKRDCANPLGDIKGLPAVDWTLNGTTTVSPTPITTGQTATFRHTVHNNGPSYADFSWNVYGQYLPVGASIDPAGWTTRIATTAVNNLAPGGNSPNAVANTYSFPVSANHGDRYCERVRYSNATGPSTPVVEDSIVCVTFDANWTLTGTTTVSAATAGAGVATTFRHSVLNNGPSQADYSWQTQYQDVAPGNAVGATWTALSATVAANNVSRSTYNPGSAAPSSYSDSYTFPAGTPAGQQHCERILYTRATGPGTASSASGYKCVTFSVPPPGPPVVTANASCLNGLRGNVTSSSGGTIAVFVSWDADGTYGAGGPKQIATGTGNFSYSVGLDTLDSSNPDRFYDAKSQVFHVYATDTATSNSPTVTANMNVICGAFTLEPTAQANLDPDSESPTQFTGTTKITPAYSGWSGPVGGVSASASNSMTKNGAVIGGGPVAQAKFLVYNSGTQSSPVLIVTLGDTYCLAINIGPYQGIVDANGNIIKVTSANKTSTSCDVVGAKPYFKVFGGDVSSGGSFSSINASCNDPGVLGAYYNNNPPVLSSNNGASAQFGVFALSLVEGFASGEGTSSTSPESAGLTFGNGTGTTTNQDVSSPKLGGQFTSAHCIYDAVAAATTSALPSTSVGALGSGAYTNAGDLTLSGGAIGNGLNIGITATQDVYITSDITYANAATWASAAEIPSFILKARNIYIDPSVQRLDGMYEATGKIYTCATGLRAPVAAVNLLTNCTRQLVIHGSFIATSVNFMRTFGSLRNEVAPHPFGLSCAPSSGTWVYTGSCAAEVFDFSPELYLAKPQIGTAGTSTRYDSISSPPPIL